MRSLHRGEALGDNASENLKRILPEACLKLLPRDRWVGQQGQHSGHGSPQIFEYELREAVEVWLAWRRVEREVIEGVLGADYDSADRAEVRTKVKDAENAAKDEVWSGYRFVVLSDSKAENGLKIIDLG